MSKPIYKAAQDIEGGLVLAGDGHVLFAIKPNPDGPLKTIQQAVDEALFIARAGNLHEELVELVKGFMAYETTQTEPPCTLPWELLDRAKDLLAKCEKGKPCELSKPS